MGVRRDITQDAAARAAFVEGVLALKEDFPGATTADLGLAGEPEAVSTYDLFIVWHLLAMGRMTPPDQGDRNAAHNGPVFLPWHRLFLLLFELQIQRVLQRPDFGLPYWDWGADGDLPAGTQASATLWTPELLGGSGDPVADGPFRHDAFTVRLATDGLGGLRRVERGLARDLAGAVTTLPASSEATGALGEDLYDEAPWGRSSGAFRNTLEGWRDGPRLHNSVHLWVGGDMRTASSPNDPVFYLHHGNVDRLWQSWMRDHGPLYLPGPTESSDLVGHRLDDPMYSILTSSAVTPADVLDVTEFATYDALP